MTMATSFAPSASSESSRPLARSFPPAAKNQFKNKLQLLSSPAAALSKEIAPCDPQTPVNRVMTGKTARQYPAGKAIFTQGDPANAVYYLLTGSVKLTVVSVTGKEAVIAHLPASTFFGESALAGEGSRTSSAYALQPATIIRIDRSVMLDLLHRERDFAEQFLSHLLSRNIRMQADLVDHLFNSCEKRLARLLLLMANFGQESKPTPVISKISQETLADMIGTTRSRVSFFLNRFREFGYIDYNSTGMVINDSLVNIVLQD